MDFSTSNFNFCVCGILLWCCSRQPCGNLHIDRNIVGLKAVL